MLSLRDAACWSFPQEEPSRATSARVRIGRKGMPLDPSCEGTSWRLWRPWPAERAGSGRGGATPGGRGGARGGRGVLVPQGALHPPAASFHQGGGGGPPPPGG